MKNYATLSPSHIKRSQRGFNLIEILVALLVISCGMLGVAGMQAVSINNTNVADFRSLAALQASSMAAAMSSNEGYWQTPDVTSSVTVYGSPGGTATITGNGLTNMSTTCNTTMCNQFQMAEYDLNTWGNTLASVLPNGWGQIDCSMPANSASSCRIRVFWSEKSYAQNQVSGSASNTSTQYDFEMMVQP